MKNVCIVLTALVVLSACSFHVRYADAVEGKAVQQKIDETVTPMLHSYDQSLRIKPSRCEQIIPESTGTMGTCTLSVNGVPLNIRVSSAGAPDYFSVDFGGAFFFEMPKVEKIIAKYLAQNNVVGSANCGSPSVRLLQPGTYITCAFHGSLNVKSVRLKAMENGQIFVYYPTGAKVRGPIPSSLLSSHKHGRTAIAQGKNVEAFIAQILSAAENYGSVTVRCPDRMNLTGMNHGTCVAPVPHSALHQRLGVWIDDSMGIRMRPIDAVIDRNRVQELAEEDLNRRLADNGDTADAVVVCEKGLVVVPWPSTFYCKLRAGGKRYKLIVTVEDFRGTVHWTGVRQ